MGGKKIGANRDRIPEKRGWKRNLGILECKKYQQIDWGEAAEPS